MAFDTNKRRPQNIVMRDAHIMWNNFDGLAHGKYDVPGKRYVNLRIDDPDLAEILRREGWNVKSYEKNGEVTYFLKANLKYRNAQGEPLADSLQPLVEEMTSNGRIISHTEDTIASLQGARFSAVKIAIRPYDFDPDKPLSAFVKTLKVKVAVDDEFAEDDDFQEFAAVGEDELPF